MSGKPCPETPDPKDARATPTSAGPDVGVPLPPIPGPNPPGSESPHDFVRRRMRELREARVKKDG
jgi:hypothetical protein